MYRLVSAILTRKFLVACFALASAVATAPGIGNAASSPEDTMRSFYSTLLTAMKNGPALGKQGRYDQLAPVIRLDFDLSYMSRMAVGPAWSGLSDDQKKQVSDAFARYMTATYADNFDSYSGEKLEVTGQQTTSNGTIVQSRIVKSNGEPVSMNYLMRQNNGEWQVDDIYLTGTISQLATLRSQFSSVLAREGANGLVVLLNRKAQSLIASATP
jgi:phospholipid transport system substrate-binding protein